MSEIPDPFGGAELDDDPFATADDVKASFTPKPTLEDLDGRLLVMVPRAFTDEAPKAKQFWKDKNVAETQDRYTVDLVVLDGGPLTYKYYGQPDAQGNRAENENTVEPPFMWTDAWRNEASLIGQLRKVDGTARPMLLGVLRKGPQADDRKAGKGFAEIAAAFEAFYRNPRLAKPKFSWQMDVDGVTPAQHAAALDWYRQALNDGFRLTK